jgi:hypothetical protein
MPINYKKYPKNWKTEIRPSILKRAQNKCEKCGVENGQIHPTTGSLVILTVSHQDHDVKNNKPDNLLALCQKCHFACDSKLHRMNSNKTRMKKIASEMTKDFHGKNKSYKNVGEKVKNVSRRGSQLPSAPTSKKNAPRLVYTPEKERIFEENDENQDDELEGKARRERVSPRVKHTEHGIMKLGRFCKVLYHKELELGVKRVPQEGKYEFVPTWHFFSSNNNTQIKFEDMSDEQFKNFIVSRNGQFRVVDELDGSKSIHKQVSQYD